MNKSKKKKRINFAIIPGLLLGAAFDIEEKQLYAGILCFWVEINFIKSR